jgi:hypothetical protein
MNDANEILEALLSLKEATETGFKRVDDRFAANETRVDRFEANVFHRFDEVDRRLDAMDLRFDAMDLRFDAMDLRFDATDQRLDSIDRRLVAVEIAR